MLLLLARMDRVHTTGISSTIGKECGNSEGKSPDRFRAETMARSWWTRTQMLADGAACLGFCHPSPRRARRPCACFGISVFCPWVHSAIIPRPRWSWDGPALPSQIAFREREFCHEALLQPNGECCGLGLFHIAHAAAATACSQPLRRHRRRTGGLHDRPRRP